MCEHCVDMNLPPQKYHVHGIKNGGSDDLFDDCHTFAFLDVIADNEADARRMWEECFTAEEKEGMEVEVFHATQGWQYHGYSQFVRGKARE